MMLGFQLAEAVFSTGMGRGRMVGLLIERGAERTYILEMPTATDDPKQPFQLSVSIHD